MAKRNYINPSIYQRDWFTFRPVNDEATVHASYAVAVCDAQYRGCTDSRPKRLAAGHYQLFGCGGHEYWIVSKRVMQEQFPSLMDQAYDDAA